jgi:hypothetical protein
MFSKFTADQKAAEAAWNHDQPAPVGRAIEV